MSSTGSNKAMVGLSIFLIGFLCGIGSTYVFSRPLSSALPTSLVVSISPSVSPRDREEFLVQKVIDGDTIELGDGRKVRYIGIDTPETADSRRGVQCFGKEASEYNKKLVLGKMVRMEKDVSETDGFGRLLRYIYINQNGEKMMVNETLVREGFALARTIPPDVKYQTLFQEAEKRAREQNRGLWSHCPLPTPTKKTKPTQ